MSDRWRPSLRPIPSPSPSLIPSAKLLLLLLLLLLQLVLLLLLIRLLLRVLGERCSVGGAGARVEEFLVSWEGFGPEYNRCASAYSSKQGVASTTCSK